MATHFGAFCARLPAAHEFFHLQTLAYLWLALGAAKVLHELGHGLSCKACGGEVHELGALLLCFTPTLYCDVSDAWTLRSKWRRIGISFAGIYVELLIAALATFVWWNASGHPFLSHLTWPSWRCAVSTRCCSTATPCCVSMAITPSPTGSRSPTCATAPTTFSNRLLLEQCLGIEPPPVPPMTPGRRALFVGYAIASFVYRGVVTCAVFLFLYQFLKPYHLGPVSVLLACWAVASMMARPALRFAGAFYQRRRLPKMKLRRVLVSAVAVAGLVLVVWKVPLPVGRIRGPALVELQTDAVEKSLCLRRRRSRVCTSTKVSAYTRASCWPSSPAWIWRIGSPRRAPSTTSTAFSSMSCANNSPHTTDPPERGRFEVALAAVSGERDASARDVDLYEKMMKRLELRAPRSGVVIGAPRLDTVGKFWERDSDTPFCRIGNPASLRALMPISPADYSLLKEELARLPQLDGLIRAPGTDIRTWHGRLSRLPESEVTEIPLPLTSKAGGPVAVQPGNRPGVEVPQAQQYLVAVDFLESDAAVYPGTLAQVKVNSGWHTCGWWLWRTVSSIFDLGLI